MQVHAGWKVAGLALVGAGAALSLAACAGKRPDDGPMGALTKGLLQQLQPAYRSGALDVATQSVLEVRGADGALRGTYDGARLLRAADAHAYGAPRIGDPAVDVRGDGAATFDEVRQVVRHFDADGSGGFDNAEQRAFEAAVGIRWLPNQT